jgi:hypothetical protein
MPWFTATHIPLPTLLSSLARTLHTPQGEYQYRQVTTRHECRMISCTICNFGVSSSTNSCLPPPPQFLTGAIWTRTSAGVESCQHWQWQWDDTTVRNLVFEVEEQMREVCGGAERHPRISLVTAHLPAVAPSPSADQTVVGADGTLSHRCAYRNRRVERVAGVSGARGIPSQETSTLNRNQSTNEPIIFGKPLKLLVRNPPLPHIVTTSRSSA